MANGEGDAPRGSAQGAGERERRLREELEEQDQQLKRTRDSEQAIRLNFEALDDLTCYFSG